MSEDQRVNFGWIHPFLHQQSEASTRTQGNFLSIDQWCPFSKKCNDFSMTMEIHIYQVIQFVTFLSPSWRSLNLWKGHLTIPKRSQRIARQIVLTFTTWLSWSVPPPRLKQGCFQANHPQNLPLIVQTFLGSCEPCDREGRRLIFIGFLVGELFLYNLLGVWNIVKPTTLDLASARFIYIYQGIWNLEGFGNTLHLGISIQHFRLENFGGNDFPRPSGAHPGRFDDDCLYFGV